MNRLNVALLQILPGKSLEENLHLGLAACRQAKEKGADIALFPEMWSNGYDLPEDLSALKAQAVEAGSAFVAAFGALAQELNMAIGVTLLEKFEPLPRNALVLFDRHGNRVLTYAKVHTCDFGDECRLTPGKDFYVSDLDTENGPVQVGGNDLLRPGVSRECAAADAQGSRGDPRTQCMPHGDQPSQPAARTCL